MAGWWLVKSEPGAWSWADQVKAGAKGTHWNGVRNHQAAASLKAMAVGDRAFFYHSVDEKQVVGILEVIKTYYPDPSDETGRFGMVDVKALLPLPKPVTLAQIKADARLDGIGLVKQSRLSVMPVSPGHTDILLALGGLKKRP